MKSMQALTPKSRGGLARSALIATSLSLAAGGLCIFADWYAVQPSGSTAFLWLSMIAALPALAAVVTAPIAAIMCLFSRRRRDALRVLLMSLIFPGALFGAGRIGGQIRTNAFAALAERSAPLIDAIKAYEAKYAKPPESLGSLVPEFLPRIPTTGIRAYPEYEYHVADDTRTFEGNPWMLVVFTPVGVPDFDQFMYYPLQNYPDYFWGRNPVERIRDWAYVHE